jgi:thiol-disulfide isomerase/thioredoxin
LKTTEAGDVLWLRRFPARGLDVVAVLVLLAAVARFVVIPQLHNKSVPAPAVSLAALDGDRFVLEHERGRMVFLDFWATWCEPCRDAIPLVQDFRRTHPDVVVESIDVGESAGVARPFARRFAMRDVALDPDQTVAHAFGVDGFPTLVAIDPSGHIRGRWIGFEPAIERAMSATVTRFGPTSHVALGSETP